MLRIRLAAFLLGADLGGCIARPPVGPRLEDSSLPRTVGWSGFEDVERTAETAPPARTDSDSPEPPSASQVLSADRKVNQGASGRKQNETSIAVSPLDDSNLAGVWRDEDTGDAREVIVSHGWSFDGGLTWQSARYDPPELTVPATDPSITADGEGNFHLGLLTPLRSIEVAKSTDGGVTFGPPVRVVSGGANLDKPFIAADPAGTDLYTVWHDAGTPGELVVFFSKSTDGNVSWSPRLQISDPGGIQNGEVPLSGPNGEIYVVWRDNNSPRILFDRSPDGGATWLAPDITIANVVPAPDLLPGDKGIPNPYFPSIAVDRSNGPFRGRIYVVWPDARFGDADVVASWSSDGGLTWSGPARVNDDPPGRDQFHSWVATDGAGRVHVTWLDRRRDPENLKTDLYTSLSADGGEHWGRNVDVTDTNTAIAGGKFNDYHGVAAAGDVAHPLFVDSRLGDQDIWTDRIHGVDYDGDGVPNDGDASGIVGDGACTAGQTSGCDDRCPGDADSGQEDGDGDGRGEACDNCPGLVNSDQADGDGDATGDPCDPCVADYTNDLLDHDALCAPQDNCIKSYNPLQLDADADGDGDVCDSCLDSANASQADADYDGVGDPCDCAPQDFGDGRPPEVRNLQLSRSTAGATLTWDALRSADAYTIVRGMVGNLPAGDHGSCIARNLTETAFTDPDLPEPGVTLTYLIQADDDPCGRGTLGWRSDETERTNYNPAPCAPLQVVDRHPVSETTVTGTRQGSLANVGASDDIYELLLETLAGPLGGRYSMLEHRWTFNVEPGARIELHSAAQRIGSVDGESFRYEYSSDGGHSWTPLALAIPFVDDNHDRFARLPSSLSGSVTVRIVDTDRTPGNTSLDRARVDELFIRSVN